jgi:membrane-associated phospholipid phosphatase
MGRTADLVPAARGPSSLLERSVRPYVDLEEIDVKLDAEAAPLGAVRPAWGMRRTGSDRPAGNRGWMALVGDWLPIAAILAAYELLRDVVPLFGVAPRDLSGFDRALFGGRLAGTILQAYAYVPSRVSPWDVGASGIYFMHFVLPVTVGLYLWFGDRSRFRAFAASLVAVSILAFFTYVAMPALPPWLGHPAETHKVIDETIAKLRIPTWVVGVYAHRDYNVAAAFPSLHSAFPLIAAVHVWQRNRRIGLLLMAWTVLVWLSVVYLGEHYVVDVIGGVAYAGAAMALAAGWHSIVSRDRR